jgi:hypothetical protein
MRLFNHLFLRCFAVLLATMFILNTVYAGGMMVSIALTQSQQNHAVQQLHESQHAESAHQHLYDGLNAHEVDHKPASHGGCKHCNYCLACSSMMINSLIIKTINTNKLVLVESISPLYLSPTSPQLQKPPIA